MSLLPPTLLQKLSRSRLHPVLASARSGVGERRSKGKGSGMEFADHRDYQPGDDIRHLDRHVYSRLGQHVIKQFSLYQQLQITILVDTSASMGIGSPPKLRRAAQLAGVLAYVGLTGGDRVTTGSFSAEGIVWHPRLEGTRRIAALLDWLERLTAKGGSHLPRTAHKSLQRMPADGLLLVVSDWLDEGVQQALTVWRGAGQELVGFRVLAPEEVEPERLGDGPVRLLDVETGQEVEVALEGPNLSGYKEALASWNARLQESFYAQQARLFLARSDDDLERTVLNEWRVKQLIS